MTVVLEHPRDQVVDQGDVVDARAIATEIDVLLRDLSALAPLVDELVDSHQRGLGFLSPDAKAALDTAVRQEKRSRVDTNPRFRPGSGLQWMRGTTSSPASGSVQVPGNAAAISAQAEIHFTLTHLTRRILRALDRAGVCALHRLSAAPSTLDRIEHLQALVWTAPAVHLLLSVRRDLRHVVDTADLVVDGNDKTTYGECPHCGRPSVVVYFRPAFLIRCDRDQKTGHYERCTCGDEYCPCKYKPTSHRHTWQKDRPHAHDGIWTFDRLRKQREAHNSSPSDTGSSEGTTTSKEPQP